MIWLTKLDGSQVMLNDDQIVFVERQHDTLISLVNGDKLRVLETPSEIAARIAHWRRQIGGFDALLGAEPAE
ncbi:MAG TPA: flagellar FlbD family protein [Myxococcota bacterium]|nr:flagellar FlbD family protein [Myxococcota bacterium]